MVWVFIAYLLALIYILAASNEMSKNVFDVDNFNKSYFET